MGTNWNSELFYIENSRLIKVGHINYSDGDGLTFYKIRAGKELLMKKWMVRINGDTPVNAGPHIDFNLAHYWAGHLGKFIN